MAKLEFFYGVMNSSKTTNLLQVDFNYKELGYKPLIIKPCLDTRDGEQKGVGTIQSRLIKEGRECLYVSSLDEVYKDLRDAFSNKKYDVLFVDEVQFFSETDICILADICDSYDIPVLCYGLKTDSNGNLFKASGKLFAISDKQTEVKQVCKCGRKAIMHVRLVNGKPVLNDSSVAVEDGKVEYRSVCRKCWKELTGSNLL